MVLTNLSPIVNKFEWNICGRLPKTGVWRPFDSRCSTTGIGVMLESLRLKQATFLTTRTSRVHTLAVNYGVSRSRLSARTPNCIDCRSWLQSRTADAIINGQCMYAWCPCCQKRRLLKLVQPLNDKVWWSVWYRLELTVEAHTNWTLHVNVHSIHIIHIIVSYFRNILCCINNVSLTRLSLWTPCDVHTDTCKLHACHVFFVSKLIELKYPTKFVFAFSFVFGFCNLTIISWHPAVQKYKLVLWEYWDTANLKPWWL